MTTYQAPSVQLSYLEAVVDAIAGEMRRDRGVVMIGQDIGRFGGPMEAQEAVRGIRCSSAIGGTDFRRGDGGRRDRRGSLWVTADCGHFVRRVPTSCDEPTNKPNAEPALYDRGSGSGPACGPDTALPWQYGGHPQDYSSWFSHVPGLMVVIPATRTTPRA